jgi:hypothetical protein
MISLGLFRPEHSELALIGFVFLFVLSFVVLNTDLQHVTGVSTVYTYNGVVPTQISNTIETDVYSNIPAGVLYHTLGYWLIISSVIGFIGVLISLPRVFK